MSPASGREALLRQPDEGQRWKPRRQVSSQRPIPMHLPDASGHPPELLELLAFLLSHPKSRNPVPVQQPDELHRQFSVLAYDKHSLPIHGAYLPCGLSCHEVVGEGHAIRSSQRISPSHRFLCVLLGTGVGAVGDSVRSRRGWEWWMRGSGGEEPALPFTGFRIAAGGALWTSEPATP